MHVAIMLCGCSLKIEVSRLVGVKFMKYFYCEEFENAVVFIVVSFGQ
jgi:hypothetical protein